MLWWPYRRLVRHRGWMSHTPLLGSTCRLLLLLGWLLLVALLGCLLWELRWWRFFRHLSRRWGKRWQ